MPDSRGRFSRGEDNFVGIPSPLAVLGQMAMPQIANELASIFGTAPDRYPNTADPNAGGAGPDGGEGPAYIHRKRKSFAQSPFSGLGG